jgi:hypothetical protein
MTDNNNVDKSLTAEEIIEEIRGLIGDIREMKHVSNDTVLCMKISDEIHGKCDCGAEEHNKALDQIMAFLKCQAEVREPVSAKQPDYENDIEDFGVWDFKKLRGMHNTLIELRDKLYKRRRRIVFRTEYLKNLSRQRGKIVEARRGLVEAEENYKKAVEEFNNTFGEGFTKYMDDFNKTGIPG